MSGSVAITTAWLASLYEEGNSLAQTAKVCGLPISTVRSRLLVAGVQLRTRDEGLRLRAEHLSAMNSRPRGPLSEQAKRNIATARRAWGEANAKGTSVKPNGYVEYTRGEHKGRSVHVVVMEERLGRRLKPDEHVHHINGDRTDNSPDNLALVTRSGHARLHRREEMISGNDRRRENGRFA